MIPGADMFNHDPDKQSVQIGTDGEDFFVMKTVSTRRIPQAFPAPSWGSHATSTYLVRVAIKIAQLPLGARSGGRTFVTETVVNLCALVDGGQPLFCFVRVLDDGVFFIAVNRVLRHSDFERVPFFFLGRPVQIRNSHPFARNK